MDQFDNTVKNLLSVVDNNEYLSAALSLFLILYAGLAAPKLPEYIARLFDNPLFKLLVFFLIAYSAKKNPTVAIIAAVGLMVSLHTLSRYKVNGRMINMVRQEAVVSEAEAEAEAEANGEAIGEGFAEGMEQLVMEEAVSPIPEEQIPEEILAELQAEEGVPEAGAPAYVADYKNSFYPQYANMKPDAYMARYTGNDIGGYDPSAQYAGAGPRGTYGSNGGGTYDGKRGAYQ